MPCAPPDRGRARIEKLYCTIYVLTRAREGVMRCPVSSVRLVPSALVDRLGLVSARSSRARVSQIDLRYSWSAKTTVPVYGFKIIPMRSFNHERYFT